MSIDGANLGIDAERSCEAVLGGKQPEKSEMRTPEQMRQYLMLLDEGFKGDLYDEVKKRQGGRDMDFTGFMVGWAENAARYVKGKPEKSNPAIVEIQPFQ